MLYKNLTGVPDFLSEVYCPRSSRYCLCIPVINEGERIIKELRRAKKHHIHQLVDIIICDGKSYDGSTDREVLEPLGVNTLLIKQGEGKQGAQLRMGMWWALNRGYQGIITVDGNNKDSIEHIPRFIKKMDEGFDFIQGSRFIKGGRAVNTPLIRLTAVTFIHAPLTSLAAGCRFTDSTNAYRAYSAAYLMNPKVQPFRDIFISYELLAYLAVRASQLNLKVCEVPVWRIYPKKGKIPTKISRVRGNVDLFLILINTLLGKYNPC